MSLTIRELANHLKLSPTTVSDALKDDPKGYVAPATRDRIRHEAKRLGYRPNLYARRLALRRADNVAVIFTALGWFRGPLSEKVCLIQDALLDDGFEVAFHRVSRPESKDARGALESYAAQRPALMLLNAHVPDCAPLFEEAAQFIADGGALIAFDDLLPPALRKLLPDVGWDEVIFDRKENTRLATEHLLSLGHTRLGLFLNPEQWPVGERADGVRAALAAAGRDLTHDVTSYRTETIAGFETGARIAEMWLAEAPERRPTGMVLLNDETAGGFMTRVRREGVDVPGDVSIVGHDAIPSGEHFGVPLTTVTHPVERIASAVIVAARARLAAGPDVPVRRTVIDSELIVRGSTAAPSTRRKQ